jgi:hypothetical protein
MFEFEITDLSELLHGLMVQLLSRVLALRAPGMRSLANIVVVIAVRSCGVSIISPSVRAKA